MPLNRLKRNFEERRLSLIETLQKQRDALDLSKQHQLYGAIKEIENFLKAIDSIREEQLSSTDFELKREGERPIGIRANLAVQRVGDRTRSVFSAIVVAFNERLLKGTKQVIGKTKQRIQLYKEVTKEVKERSKKSAK